jgi:hypothetical protein
MEYLGTEVYEFKYLSKMLEKIFELFLRNFDPAQPFSYKQK